MSYTLSTKNTSIDYISGEIYESYPLENGNVAGSWAKYELLHEDTGFTLTVNSSIYIDQGQCISKLRSLKGLKDHMIDAIMKSHELESDEPQYEIDSDEDVTLSDSMLEFIVRHQKAIDDDLRYNIRTQVENELSLA